MNVIGFRRENTCCFRSTVTTLRQGDREFAGKWATVKRFVPGIIERGYSETLGKGEVYDLATHATPVYIPTIPDLAQVVLRELARDKPRPYQIECFVNAAQRNTVVYLPTGAGENSDEISLKKLRDHDAIVVTAQVLINWIQGKYLRLEDVSLLVLDEVHHTVKNHPYSVLVNRCYRTTDVKYRPLLLGLSASPVSGDPVSMNVGLGILCDLMEAQIFMPFIFWKDLMETINRPSITFHTVETTDECREMASAILDYCKGLIKTIREKMELPWTVGIDKLDGTGQARGLLRSLIAKAHDSKNNDAVGLLLQIQQIFTAEELNSILGPKYARIYIQELLSANSSETASTFLQTIKGADSLSDKVSTLFSVLSSIEVNDTTRAIVFVQTKKTARYLCRVLVDHEGIDTKWKPTFFVGQSAGQLDGMSWADHQSPVLQKFRTGEHKLLISTSVLQEGIDVPVCNNVILFDQSWTLTSFIQSRGRARANDSRYVLICSEAERISYQELIASEKTMHHVILQHMAAEKTTRSISALTTLQLNIQASLALNWTRSDYELSLGADSNSSEDVRKRFRTIQMRFHNLVGEVSNWTLDSFPFLSELPLKNFVSVVEEDPVFSGKMLMRLNAEPSSNSAFRIPEIAKLVCSTSELLSEDHILMSFKTERSFSRIADQIMLVGENIDLGTFATPCEFVCLRSLPSTVKVVFNVGMEEIQVFMVSSDRVFRIDFCFTILDNFIAIDLGSDEKATSMYLSLKSPAMYYYAHTDSTMEVKLVTIDRFEWYRASSAEIAEFINIEEVSVYKIDMFLTNNVRDHLVNTLRKIEIRGLHVVYGRFSTLEPRQGDLCAHDLFQLSTTVDNFEFKCDVHVLMSTCMESLLYRTPSALFLSFLTSVRPELRHRLMMDMILRLQNCRFANVMLTAHASLASLTHEMIQTQTNLLYESSNIQYDKAHNTALVRFVILTPTRLVFQHPKKITRNRILRAFDSDYFLRVHFRDEDMQKLSMAKTGASIKNVHNRISNFLCEGTAIGDRRYEFLAMSSSQLRDHGCWFVAPHLIRVPGEGGSVQDVHVDADYIRRWCGDFSSIKNVAKYVARLGHSLSASIDVAEIELHDSTIVPDYEVTTTVDGIDRTYTYSDGIGMITYGLAKAISDRMGFSTIPTAFQIRFAGFKGVLAIRPDSTTASEDKRIWFRPSMQKFESSHRTLEVLNWSAYIPCYLNRQVLVIFSSLGVPDEAFMNLQDQMLKSMPNMLLNSTESSSWLESNLRVLSPLSSKVIQSWSLDSEPFFRSLLITVYRRRLVDLLTRSRVFVPMGRIIMGVIDETGTLKENEVFVQISKQPSDEEAVRLGILRPGREGCWKVVSEVSMAKNPCMHPGDARRLRAVDNELLQRFHFDCVVFPRKGPRPLTDMCSGSDLDGDLYFVTWDPALLLPTSVEPMDYAAPPAKVVTEQVTTADIREFLVKFISVDQLGPISNAHIAHADVKPDGVRDPVCVHLAYLCSLAVDFPKTGILPDFPKEHRPISWPDFMQKQGMTTHVSQKVTGQMYRKAKSIFYSATGHREIKPDSAFLVAGYEKYLPSARDSYRDYCDCLNGVLRLYGFGSEAQVFSGSRLEPEMMGIDESRRIMEVRQSFSLVSFSKASAWYYVTYHEPIKPRGLVEPVLSFPWIVTDYLIEAREKNGTIAMRADAVGILGQQVVQWAQDCIKHEVSGNLVECRNFFNLLKELLKTIVGDNVCIELSGSTIGLANRAGSDINVYMDVSEEVLFGQVYTALNSTFPMVKHPSTLEHRGSPYVFTIFRNIDWHLPALRLCKMTIMDPGNLAIVLVLLRWARAQTLVRSSTRHSGKMSSLSLALCALDIGGLAIPDAAAPSFENISAEISHVNEHAKSLGSFEEHKVRDLGECVLKILHHFAFESEETIRRGLSSDIHVGKNGVVHLREYSFQAYQLLAQTLNISSLWEVSHSPDVEMELALRSKRPRLVRRHGLAASVFLEGSSTLLFDDSKTKMDSINFDMHHGSRRPQHFDAQCYVPVLQSFDKLDPLCLKGFLYQEFFSHAYRQLDLARRMGSEEFGIIKAAIKFGNLYVTNLPRLFLEDGTSATVNRVQEALRLGYKALGDSSTEQYFKRRSAGVDLDFAKAEEKSPIEPAPVDSLRIEPDENEEPKHTKPVVKKKSTLAAMNSSFEPFVSDESVVLSFLAKIGMISTGRLSGYAVSLALFNSAANGNSEFQIIYDDQLQFTRMRYRPLRWMNIDVKGRESNGRDYRFVLSSAKSVDMDMTADTSTDVKELIKRGVVERVEHADTPIVNLRLAPKFRECDHVMVRCSRGEKYGFGNIRAITRFLEQHPQLNSIPISLLQRLQVTIIQVTEYTGHNVTTGLFQDIRDKHEMELSFVLDWTELAAETNDFILTLIPALWGLSHFFRSHTCPK
ncbi:RNA dependent RNA polymerase family protein [Paramicrosporidium saccamoebae]|uniref:RNA-directed RNA polymerase n=1 Tax=Paramicrosporidium saccamoebae TaxID=1246581 RepID=A0A2H9TP26_9FUNG|nr:RNA dependent RNA polymerase family protein [Paramicrosporidium saccamoebae]